MSLLMDALRKAERARQEMAETSAESVAGQQESEAPVAPVGVAPYPDLSLAPLEAGVQDQPLTMEPPREPALNVSREKPGPTVEDVAVRPAARADVGAAAPARGATAASSAKREPISATASGGSNPRHGASAPQASRVKANAVFQSKRAVPPRRSSGPRLMLLAGVVLVVLVAGAGAYLYLIDDGSALVPAGQMAYQTPPAEALTVSGSTEGVVESAAEPPLAAVANMASEPPSVTPALRLTPESAVPPMDGAPLYAARPEAMVSVSAPQPATPAEQVQVSAAAPVHEPVRVVRSVSPGKLDGMLRAAWEAFMQGDVARARDGYQGVLGLDGMNRDGLLGMAAVEAAEGNRSAAAGYYRRLLERDPRDGAALEGVAALGGVAGVPDEQALRALGSGGGTVSGGAQFALGNLYAAQERWADAQAAWFDAYGRAPDNPDYAFNLAISLEHLGQRQPALNYYRQAVELARQRPHGFDPAQAQSRIEALLAQGGNANGR